MIAGIASGPDDRRHVPLVRTDRAGRMDLDDLTRIAREQLAQDAPAPIFACATLGTTSTGAFDDVKAIRDRLDQVSRDLTGKPWDGWLHADAAWAGAALVCPEHRHLGAGLEHADSLCINPHKWLLTNFDCDLFWTRSRRDVIAALSLTPEYLRNDASERGDVIDYRDWQVPLGRRFRALKLWFVLRMYGLDALRAHIRRHVALAEWLEAKIAQDDRFELAAPRSLALVCLRLRAGDDATAALLERVNATGEVFLSHTRLPTSGDGPGAYVIRVAIGATLTARAHVEALWRLLCAEADAVLGSPP
ncbi:MAG: pyridoxal-dependent decarboxylase [Phycisphaerales bacterium]